MAKEVEMATGLTAPQAKVATDELDLVADLPTPGDLPDADVVIFDGACKFCQLNVHRLWRWDGAERISFLAIDDPVVARRWPELNRDDLMQHMHIVDRFGDVHIGAAAFRYLSRRLPRLWPLALLMHIPLTGPIWRAGYRWFARRRYLLSKNVNCTDDSCDIHLN